jgi:hypothetical protein
LPAIGIPLLVPVSFQTATQELHYPEDSMTRPEIICEEIVFQKIVLFEDMKYGQEGKHMGKRETV